MAFVNSAKSSSTFSNGTKNSSTFTSGTKNPSGLTFADLPMSLLESAVFQNAILSDGTALADVTFETPLPSSLINEYIRTVLWTNTIKN